MCSDLSAMMEELDDDMGGDDEFLAIIREHVSRADGGNL